MKSESAVWFVTGCSRGLGRELAVALIDHGARLVATARHVDTIRSLASGRENQVLTLPLDICNRAQVTAASAAAHDVFGRIDVLVNNAGYSYLGAVEEIGEGAARQQFDTNFFGPVSLIQAVLPGMRERRKGHIVNVSSVGGFAALPACGQYSATKFALEGLSEALAQELAPLGIKVLVIEPNGFRTDFLKASSMQLAPNLIEAYEPTRGAVVAKFSAIEGKQPSDPKRGAFAIIAAVESENGPFRLTLGTAGVKRIREKLASMEKEITAWEHLSNSVNFADTTQK